MIQIADSACSNAIKNRKYTLINVLLTSVLPIIDLHHSASPFGDIAKSRSSLGSRICRNKHIVFIDVKRNFFNRLVKGTIVTSGDDRYNTDSVVSLKLNRWLSNQSISKPTDSIFAQAFKQLSIVDTASLRTKQRPASYI